MSTPNSGGKKKLIIILAVVSLVSVGAGACAPLVLKAGNPKGASVKEEVEKPAADVSVSFGEVTVNLSGHQLNRYLRVKIILVTDTKHCKKCEETLEEKKAILKNWLIAHLSDKTLQDVTGRISINRIRREIQEYFSSKLFDKGEQLRDVLFEEFVVT